MLCKIHEEVFQGKLEAGFSSTLCDDLVIIEHSEVKLAEDAQPSKLHSLIKAQN